MKKKVTSIILSIFTVVIFASMHIFAIDDLGEDIRKNNIRTRTELINHLIETNNFKSYLEVGLNNPHSNFTKIKCESKDSVDPYYVSASSYSGRFNDGNTEANVSRWLPYCTHRMTSDEFFATNDKIFDIIFIDGLHTEEQVDKDIYNSLKFLSVGGYIIVHDCIPPTESHQAVPRVQGAWNGTVWKAFVKISQMKNPNLKTYVLNSDWGCGIIQKLGDVDYPFPEPLDMQWKDFYENRYSIYNIIETK